MNQNVDSFYKNFRNTINFEFNEEKPQAIIAPPILFQILGTFGN